MHGDREPTAYPILSSRAGAREPGARRGGEEKETPMIVFQALSTQRFIYFNGKKMINIK